MLVNCPKCGFSQPEDKYCANCGIDMESFKPQEKKASLRFLTHPAVQIVGVFLIIFFAIAFIRSRHVDSTIVNQDTQKMVLSHAEATPTSSPDPGQAAQASGTPNREADAAPPMMTPDAVRNAGDAAATDATPTASASGTDTAAAAVAAGATKPVKLKIILAEVDDLTLKKWSADAPSRAISGTDWTGGLIPTIKQKMSEDRSIVTLESSQKTIDPTHLNQDLFFGKTMDGNDVGFHVNVSISDMSGPNINTHINLVRQIDTDDPKSVEFDMELPPKGAWMISHALTNHPDFNKEAVDDPKSFFQIFKSERFKSKRSDFTIIILFDTDSGT